MTKIRNILKNNIRLFFGIALGLIVSGISIYVVYAASASDYRYTNNGQSTVSGALDTLYTKANKKILQKRGSIGWIPGTTPPGTCTTPPAELSLGKYVSITPSASTFTIAPSLTGSTSSKTITPNELTKWRIIKVNACNVEVVSEYTSSKDVYFKGINGYRNFVGTLNIIASSYENPSFTVGSRMMGYDGQTEFINDISAFDGSTNNYPSTTTTSSPKSGTGEEYSGGVLGDTLYLSDYQAVNSVYGYTYAYDVSATSTKKIYWLASRRYNYGSATSFYFLGRDIDTNGYGWISYGTLCNYNSSWAVSGNAYRVRPILILKSGLTVKSGSGTLDSPYVLQ